MDTGASISEFAISEEPLDISELTLAETIASFLETIWIPTEIPEESLNITFFVQNKVTKDLAEAIAFSGVFSSLTVQTIVSIESQIEFADDFDAIVQQVIAETFGVTDTVSLGALLHSLTEALGIDQSLLGLATVSETLSDSILATDSIFLRYRLSLTDALGFADSISENLRQILSLADSISLAESISHIFSVALTLSDSVEVSGSFSETIQKVLSLQDEFSLAGQIRIDGEDYLVWGFNPKTFSPFHLKYSLNFNSIQRIGGKNLLCAPEGIYEVGGDDDDGTDISARLKTGLEDFNDPERHYPGEKLKQLLSAYLVVSTEGETLLKVTTTRRGEAVENWFKCRDTPEAMSKVQVPLSNSLRSLLYQFEIKPLAGAPAKFREVEIIPLFLSRSI